MSIKFRDLQYFKALTEASIVSKADTFGNIIYVNDNFCRITGYTPEEMIGRSHALFRHPDNPETLYKEMWDTISNGKIWHGRMTNLKKDNSTFIAETTIIPLVDEDGTITEYMAIRNDITDMVMLKRQLFEEQQEKLRQERIREVQKSFLLLFTHELKTPLNAIINFSGYIKKQLERPKELNREKLLPLLETVQQNATDMLENITMILETSKLNAHKLTYNYTVFNANTIIASLVRKYWSMINARNIRLILDTEDHMIYNDEYRFTQILTNIFSNAIKYGKDEIILSLSGDRESVVLILEDNGPGIKDKKGVFELYAQEDENLLQRKGQGTGIGLYFVKLLCDDLGINYAIEDREGGGTRFILVFNNKSRPQRSES